MTIIDDVFKGNPVIAIGLGVLTLAVPVVFPALRPQFAA